jgi:hypothetical protein
MRISMIEIRDFRGFPGPETYTFPLDGKNLLLYGENGSGKSSLFHALVEFFNLDPKARPFADHQNIFSGHPGPPLTDGHVTLVFDDDTARHAWKCGGERAFRTAGVPQMTREILANAARRAALLEYRSLLRTNFGMSDIRATLFELAVNSVLAEVPVTVSSAESSLKSQWQRLLDYLPIPRNPETGRLQGRRRNPTKAEVIARAQSFNEGFRAVLPDVERLAAQFLAYFAGYELELKLSLPGVRYEPRRNATGAQRFAGREMDVQVRLHGVALPEWNSFLNEARLSALALSLYLAATVLSNPGVAGPLRLLVLDDVLIGLDHANREPVLRIIEERFSAFQVLLLTHDRVWFEMVRSKFEHSDNWKTAELACSRHSTGSLSFDKPVVKWPKTDPATEHLRKADEFLNTHHDLQSAAFHARVAFETKLKGFCKKQKLAILHDPDGRQPDTDDFLDVIEEWLGRKGRWPMAMLTVQRVKMYRKTVLNPLAHDHPITLAAGEVRAAVDAVRALRFHDESGKAPKSFAETAAAILAKPALSHAERLDAAGALRTAFEVDVRTLLVRLGGRVPYRHDPGTLTTAEIWDAAREALTSANPAAAAPLIADVEAHRSLFLETWSYDGIAAFTHPQLTAGWDALRDPTATGAPKTRLATFR